MRIAIHILQGLRFGGLLLISSLHPAMAADDAATEQAKALGQLKPQLRTHNPHPQAQWFPKAGFGLFIHWGLASVGAKGDLSWSMLANRPWFDGTSTPNEYYGYAKSWKPNHLDLDRILAEAKAAGMEYAVFVTKHHDGFTLWPSNFGDLGTKQTFGGRDFVGEFVTACRKHHLKVGLYYSPPDWWFDRTIRSFAMRGPALDMDHQPIAKLPAKPKGHDAARNALVAGQVRELLTRYGRIDQIWFDGGDGRAISNDEVRTLQPGIIVNRRNGGNGDYADSEGTLPNKKFNGWFEACIPAWPVRMWSAHRDYGQTPSNIVLSELVMIRAWGGNLLSNLGPMADGSLPDEVHTCWKELADWMKHSKESISDVEAGPWPDACNVPVTRRGNNVAYLHFLPKLPDKLPGLPAAETSITETRKILPLIKNDITEAIWRTSDTPLKATLLRTGANVPFQIENGTIHISLDPHLRTSMVDVVKVEFSTPAKN